MLTTLIESRRRSRRSTGSTAASVIAHATLITLVAAVTAHASDDTPAHQPPARTVIYVPISETPPSREKNATSKTRTDDAPPLPKPLERQIHVPIDIPTTFPPVDLSEHTVDASDFVIGEHPTSDVVGTPYGQGGSFTAWQVEKETIPLAGNPRPQYPSLLQSAHVDGEVLAQFVVDSAGRVEMSTFRAIRSTNDLFTNAVRRALVQWKFQPAEVDGRRVRQLVQMPLAFRVR